MSRRLKATVLLGLGCTLVLAVGFKLAWLDAASGERVTLWAEGAAGGQTLEPGQGKRHIPRPTSTVTAAAARTAPPIVALDELPRVPSTQLAGHTYTLVAIGKAPDGQPAAWIRARHQVRSYRKGQKLPDGKTIIAGIGASRVTLRHATTTRSLSFP